MLTITNTVTNKDAQVLIDNITYAIHYIITNNELSSVQCAISQDDNGVFEQIGYIRLEGGRFNTDFKENASFVEYLTVFETIVKEINDDLR